MPCYKKKKDMVLNIFLGLFVGLLSFPLYAKDKKIILNKVTANNIPCTETSCVFPGKTPADMDIHVEDQIEWGKDKDLILHTQGNIIFREQGKIISTKNGSVILKSGMLPGDLEEYKSTVIFDSTYPQIEIQGKGKIKLYYNPAVGNKSCKYHNPTIYRKNIFPKEKLELYMLVNDIYDLQDITACLYGSYALSQDIDASHTKEKEWDNGKGFSPIKNVYADTDVPFSGVFDGNGCSINNLYINRPGEDDVGLFGYVSGSNKYRSVIKDFTVKNAYINGNRCVGAAIGEAKLVTIEGVSVLDSEIHSKEEDSSGEGAGCVLINKYKNLKTNNTLVYENEQRKSNTSFFGSCVACNETE